MRNKARRRRALEGCQPRLFRISALFVIKFNCAAADRNYCPSQILCAMFSILASMSFSRAAACSPIKADEEIFSASRTVRFFAKRLIFRVNKFFAFSILGRLHKIILPLQRQPPQDGLWKLGGLKSWLLCMFYELCAFNKNLNLIKFTQAIFLEIPCFVYLVHYYLCLADYNNLAYC